MGLVVDAVWSGWQVAEVLEDIIITHGHQLLQLFYFLFGLACYLIRSLGNEIFVDLFD